MNFFVKLSATQYADVQDGIPQQTEELPYFAYEVMRQSNWLTVIAWNGKVAERIGCYAVRYTLQELFDNHALCLAEIPGLDAVPYNLDTIIVQTYNLVKGQSFLLKGMVHYQEYENHLPPIVVIQKDKITVDMEL